MFTHILKHKDYILPKVEECEYKSISIRDMPENKHSHTLGMYINDERMMTSNQIYYHQCYDVLPEYYLAYGNVICTGLGLLYRESMLLVNPKVEKITVIEKSADLIELQYKMNPEIMNNPKLEIINDDANFYKGECDFLSIDHYEIINPDKLANIVEHCIKNIKHETLWFWMLSFYCGSSQEKFYETYYDMRLLYRTLPDLTRLELYEFIMMIRGCLTFNTHSF